MIVAYGVSIVMVIITIIILYLYKKKQSYSILTIKDGATLNINCGKSGKIFVVEAKYGDHDVSNKVQQLLNKNNTFIVSNEILGVEKVSSKGLTIKYKCGSSKEQMCIGNHVDKKVIPDSEWPDNISDETKNALNPILIDYKEMLIPDKGGINGQLSVDHGFGPGIQTIKDDSIYSHGGHAGGKYFPAYVEDSSQMPNKATCYHSY